MRAGRTTSPTRGARPSSSARWRRRSRSSIGSSTSGRRRRSPTSVERSYGGLRQVHSRASILQRLLTHDAYHDGEIAVAMGSHDVEPVYIWRAYDPLKS